MLSPTGPVLSPTKRARSPCFESHTPASTSLTGAYAFLARTFGLERAGDGESVADVETPGSAPHPPPLTPSDDSLPLSAASSSELDSSAGPEYSTASDQSAPLGKGSSSLPTVARAGETSTRDRRPKAVRAEQRSTAQARGARLPSFARIV